jgi:hypothetical protein
MSWIYCTLVIRSLTLEYPSEIRKQSATEEAEEEHEPASKARNTTVSNMTKGLGLAEDGIEVSEDIECNDLRAATSRKGIMGMLAMRRF